MADQQFSRFADLFQRYAMRGHRIHDQPFFRDQLNDFPQIALRGELHERRRVVLAVFIFHILVTGAGPGGRPDVPIAGIGTAADIDFAAADQDDPAHGVGVGGHFHTGFDGFKRGSGFAAESENREVCTVGSRIFLVSSTGF